MTVLLGIPSLRTLFGGIAAEGKGVAVPQQGIFRNIYDKSLPTWVFLTKTLSQLWGRKCSGCLFQQYLPEWK